MFLLTLRCCLFFSGKTSAVCGPHLQTSAAEEVDQNSAVCKKKTVCFLTTYFHLSQPKCNTPTEDGNVGAPRMIGCSKTHGTN
ncbi:hypothetical protein HanRHA438_Chr10g0438111 [Helianthus annuus]|nr:hypothetical protein HanRHA438_Chr10g0438111 [Helianthus annuus]